MAHQPSDEFKVKLASNKWETNLDEVISFIKEASADPIYDAHGGAIPGKLYWSWVSNMRSKYVSLRFDMRDGAFVILDRNGERISFEELKWQYDSKRDG